PRAGDTTRRARGDTPREPWARTWPSGCLLERGVWYADVHKRVRACATHARSRPGVSWDRALRGVLLDTCWGCTPMGRSGAERRWGVARVAHVHPASRGGAGSDTLRVRGLRHPSDALAPAGPRDTHLLCRDGRGRAAGPLHRESRTRRRVARAGRRGTAA